MSMDSPGRTHSTTSRKPRTLRSLQEPSDPERHWFQSQNEIGLWVCERCGTQRVRPSKGRCGRPYQSTQVSETRNVLLTHRHYLETIERVLKSEREADPRIKLGYIATAIERWRQDPFATGE
jgi:hypothetical protein